MYPIAAFALAGLVGLTACKTKPIAELPEEHGRLNLISANLEKAFGSRGLPDVDENPSLAERLRAWVDFRDCAVRTYVARRRAAESAREKGLERHSYHASVGDETVEECAVQAAVSKEAPSYCDRLSIDFKREDGLPPLPALRCWDTRARVLGLPQECPLQWLPTGIIGRNAECLAMAHRDTSLCPFAPSAQRCRALVAGNADLCHDGPPDCRSAVAYWQGLVPARSEKPVFEAPAVMLADPAAKAPSDATPGLKFHLAFLADQKRSDRFQVQAPLHALGIDWPVKATAAAGSGKSDPRWGVDINQRFAQQVAERSAEVAFFGERISVRFAFAPAGLSAGTLPIAPPGPGAPATIFVSMRDEQGKQLSCQPSLDTKGNVTFAATGRGAGAFVTGHIDVQAFPCDDGSTAQLQGDFRLAILSAR